MGDIEFTQYLLPDGRTRQQWVERPERVSARAAELRAKGYRFECEMLPDMEICSFTIVHPDYDYDLGIKLAKNGPAVLDAVDNLILEFKEPGDA